MAGRARRGVVAGLAAALLLGVLGTLVTVPDAAADRRGAHAVPPAGPAVRPVRTTAGERVVQIVAHPDDDLFFMNPDTAQSLARGRSLTSMYLTAGEADGVNARRDDPDPPAPDKAAYAEARQNGIRAAYAEMATGDRTSPWSRSAVRTAGGGTAELDTLRAKPWISLVWVQLREAGSINGDRPHSLHGLWDGRVDSLASQLSSGTPVQEDFAYTKRQVVETVAGLLERFRPTFVRIQDPTPGRTAKGTYSDHQDHLYGARFAQAALARYAAVPGHPAFGVQTYLGYSTGRLPRTLGPADAAAKLHTLKTYAWTDGADHCGDPAGCGDRKVAARPAGHGWAQTVRHTRGESTTWAQPGPGGTAWAFSVLDRRLAVWHRPGPTAGWTGPRLTGDGGIDGGVTSVRLPDGRIAVLGTRTTLGARAADYRRDVVLSVQRTRGGDFGPWLSLGTPERDDESGTSAISAPAAVVDPTGRLRVFVRDSAHRLTGRIGLPGGGWEPWTPLGGTGLRGDPVAVTDASGRHTVLAPTPSSVLAWTQTGPGGPLTGPKRTGLPATTLALNATADAGGDGIRLWYRVPVTGEVRAAHFGGTSGVPGTGDRGGAASPRRAGTAGKTTGVPGTGSATGAAAGTEAGAATGTGAGTAAGTEAGTATGASAGAAGTAAGTGTAASSGAATGAAGTFVPVVSFVASTGVAGFGPVGAGGDLLAVRSRTGVLATTRTEARPRPVPVSEPAARAGWTEADFLLAGAPAGLPGGIAAISLDGALHWTPSGRPRTAALP
ncbi:PIG-L family deacetylase [Streptomyces sp. WMMC940]|uniref:PIG-L family deacetylase n=1 Tax=Streptomyces sp. WMMC940 TaxID=3015153 RepID=UPI0022B6C96A|nr:PIG-L family deacetylase [Streptomyces sp. WMMC940]MCZ7460738.1 PIG-L family deacetylase [Streptomyces sp. WMMC940]